MKLAIAALTVTALVGPASAQHHQQSQHAPYASFQQREVKALSAQQIADLRAGRGMGLALAGELNGYPGPLHVIELAESLQLTAAQRQRVQQLFEAMKTEAVSVGEQLIAQENALDRAFAERKIDPDSLIRLTSQIGETQGKLRAVHLKYHLTTAELLTAEQRDRYARLRGYH
jgi:Spy/CpxP family protein refolding chaperone